MDARYCRQGDFYPRSPCGERLHGVGFVGLQHGISIHALLAESDYQAQTAARLPLSFLSTLSLRRATPMQAPPYKYNDISIHALLAESDLKLPRKIYSASLFLSTLSLRRATRACPLLGAADLHFYPRSPCGERPWQRGSRITYVEISIHALLAESDRFRTIHNTEIYISIHALLAESDPPDFCRLFMISQISIHALLAESDVRPTGDQPSTPGISIHALLAESDFLFLDVDIIKQEFLSTLSLRRATSTT